MRLLLHWLLNALALLGVAYLLPSVQVNSFGAALVAALLLALINTLLRPLLIPLTLQVTLLTLGLFLFVLNGLTFWLAGALLPGFSVAGFWPAVFGALLYSIFTSLLSWLLPSGKN